MKVMKESKETDNYAATSCALPDHGFEVILRYQHQQWLLIVSLFACCVPMLVEGFKMYKKMFSSVLFAFNTVAFHTMTINDKSQTKEACKALEYCEKLKL